MAIEVAISEILVQLECLEEPWAMKKEKRVNGLQVVTRVLDQCDSTAKYRRRLVFDVVSTPASAYTFITHEGKASREANLSHFTSPDFDIPYNSWMT